MPQTHPNTLYIGKRKQNPLPSESSPKLPNLPNTLVTLHLKPHRVYRGFEPQNPQLREPPRDLGELGPRICGHRAAGVPRAVLLLWAALGCTASAQHPLVEELLTPNII